MKLRGYLLDKLPYFLLLTVAGVLSYVLLIGTGTSRDAALFAVLLYSLMALIALAVDLCGNSCFTATWIVGWNRTFIKTHP